MNRNRKKHRWRYVAQFAFRNEGGAHIWHAGRCCPHLAELAKIGPIRGRVRPMLGPTPADIG